SPNLFSLEGVDAHGVQIFRFYPENRFELMPLPAAPRFADPIEMSEIAENYWMALLRDVPFSQYESNQPNLVKSAIADLSGRAFGRYFKRADVGGSGEHNPFTGR